MNKEIEELNEALRLLVVKLKESQELADEAANKLQTLISNHEESIIED